MNTQSQVLSEGFRRLYCDASIFEEFSRLHPINFRRVLPFQAQDTVTDDPRLIAAEVALLNTNNEEARQNAVAAYCHCGLITQEDAVNLKSVVDFFDADFFELMGEIYANAGMFICALRWYREYVAELETRRPNMASDSEDVYASVGYCLYSLGLFEETIAWSKACIGPRQMADTVGRALIDYEAQLQGGCVVGVDRVATRTRYIVSTFDAEQPKQVTPRLKQAIQTIAPFQELYFDWIKSDSPAPEIQEDGYPFQAERDGGSLTRHRMNLLFATYGHADALIARGYIPEAKRLLYEAALLEPKAEFIRERIKTL